MPQRLFVGVELPAAVRDALAAAIERARARSVSPSGLRVLDAASWHVTLQFLGDVRDEQLAPLSQACAAAIGAHAAFEVELARTGDAPNPRNARVLWVGFARGQDRLERIARALEHATAPLGFAAQEREFRPHVTWARVKPDADARALLSAFELPPLAVQVAELVLFRSLQSSAGSRYEVVRRFGLDGAR